MMAAMALAATLAVALAQHAAGVDAAGVSQRASQAALQTVSQVASTSSAVKAVVFTMTPRDTGVPAYEIRFAADGAGMYRVTAADPGGQEVIHASQATLNRIGKAESMVATGSCATRRKNIAQTGQKSLEFSTAGGPVSCSFDFSEDAGVMDAVAAFEGIAATLRFGDALAHRHRFDRLGLDAELDSLASEVAGGRAIEVENIAVVLQSIVDDERVMERVRRKAARLLEGARSE